jgi:molecular chaperone GrpE (heat shock protein)
MWTKVIQLFKKDNLTRNDLEVWKGEILEELEGIKKVLRRQTLFLEALKKEVLAQVGEKVLQDAEPIRQLAESFFYFDSFLRDGHGLSSDQNEAAAMVWNKLEGLLASLGLELIRHTGEPFDPRFHQTVERAEGERGNMVVTKIIQPGYLYHGQVIRPARVIIGELSTKEKQEL